MSKYDPLGEYLDKQGASPVTMTFKQVENVLGFSLPQSAYKHQPWWAHGGGHSHANAWFSRGWRASVDRGAQQVTFRRDSTRTVTITEEPRQTMPRIRADSERAGASERPPTGSTAEQAARAKPVEPVRPVDSEREEDVMAITNRERVGKVMDLLKEALAPFVEREAKKAMHARKIDIRKVRQYRTPSELNKKSFLDWDVSGLLGIMLNNWNSIFSRPGLGQAERILVRELRTYRNKWAHQEPFSNAEVYRILVSISILLNAMQAPQAEKIEQFQNELCRSPFK